MLIGKLQKWYFFYKIGLRGMIKAKNKPDSVSLKLLFTFCG